LGIEVETKNSKGQTFVLIPPGKFTMGEGDKSVEVTLGKPFLLGQTEVTNAQWMAVMGSVPSKWKDDGRPVETVDWKSVAEFCYKLSEMPEEKNLGRVYRLPTEAEWEYACRAGTMTDYSFGDDESILGEYGWYANNSGKKPLDANALLESLRDLNSGEYDWGTYISRLSDNNCQTHVVGQKKPSAWGLHDMHGNVWEWCSDWHGQYGSDVQTDPRGPYLASDRVVRGGSWYEDIRYCRSAYRYRLDASRRNSTLGFRLALSPSRAKLPEAGR
jgi:formylglycine-generating enzyme required for sulfatase activity